MKLSVVIPVLNGEDYIEHSIKSALNQTQNFDEIIILDDGSTDKTGSIIEDKFSDKVKYIKRLKGNGWVDAFNSAIGLATGDYVTVLAADDILHSQFVEFVQQAHRSEPNSHFIYALCENFSGSRSGLMKKVPYLEPVTKRIRGVEYSSLYIHSIAEDRTIHRAMCAVTSKELWTKLNGFDSDIGLIADTDFFMRIGRYTDVVEIPLVLGYVRIHSDSVSSIMMSNPIQLAKDYDFMVEHFEKRYPHLSKSEKNILSCFADLFVHDLLRQGIFRARAELVSEGVRLIKKRDNKIHSRSFKRSGRILLKLARMHNGVGLIRFARIAGWVKRRILSSSN